ncbi:ECF transporter S component [Oscillospiraceae bacterium PP1C4]
MAASSAKTRYLVQLSLMAAVVAVVAFVPFLGFIPLVVIKATTVHIPVIIGAILLGPKAGGILGGVFGLTSIIKNTMEPSLVSFVFSPLIPAPGEAAGSLKALLIAMIPRILTGVLAGLVFQIASRFDSNKRVACAVAAAVGALTNTILVMSGIYMLFGQQYAQVKQIAFEKLTGVLMGVVATNGLAEAFVAVVLSVLIAPSLFKAFKK